MKVEVLIGDTDFDRRTRLKQAIRHQRVTGTVDGDPSLSGTLRKLTRPDEFDVIFVSIDFGFDKISNFIKEAKYTKSGQDCAYIVTARQSDSDNSDIARSVVEGADGVLLEPFSAESMQEVIDLSMRIKRERKLARQRAAVGVVVKEIVKNLDLASDTLRDGRTPVTRMRALNGLHETLENLESDALPLYYEALLDSMGDAIPFRPMTKSDLGILPMTRPVLSVRMNEEHGQPELEVTLEFAEGEDADLSNSLTVTLSLIHI